MVFSLLLGSKAFCLPAPPTRSSFRPSQKDLIRVRLGQFPRVNISGIDLSLNGTQTMAGSANFSAKCETQNGEAEVAVGFGQKILGSLSLESATGFLHINGKLYRGKIALLPKDNECVVVNTLSMDRYLAGLINKEMAPNWPMEAMKAQAVASRSYALAQAQLNQNKDFDLESSTLDQVYDGAASETPKSTQAVEATKGVVLTYGNAPMKAYFHANCGGMTEQPSAVWGQDSPAFCPVVCPFHKKERDKISWTVQLSNFQVESALRKIAGLLPTGFVRLARLEAGALNPNHKLSDLMVSDQKGNSLVISATAFRNAIGNQRVKSTSFEVKQENGRYVIQGQGYGHAVGMCQVGARAMAEQGKTFLQILKYYYPLAKIFRL